MRPYAVAIALLALFLFVDLRHLDAVPQVYEDEPWQASTGYKLATVGVFGSDMFAGFHNMDQRYYGFMPLHPLLLAVTFKLAGLGLAQARTETVLLSALTLVLTFALAVRLFRSAWIGALAVAVLVLVRWTGLTYTQLTGIPLVDLARIARYDPLVPVLGLAALHVYLWARQRARAWLYLAAGALAGLAGLAHVYGVFWAPALLLLACWDRARKADVALLGLGSLVPWLPYAAYVLSDLPDWHGQTAIYAARFELLNAGWYVSNLLNEFHRYGPGLGPLGLGWLLRPGFWFTLVAVPLSLIALGRRALACDASARAVVVPAVLFPLLFALFITIKLVNYTLIELPLFAVAVAWGVLELWRSRRFVVRACVACVGVALAAEGAIAMGALDRAAALNTPYPTFVGEVRQFVPAGARVMGLHSYWIGFQQYDYRSFLLPLNFADEGMPLDQALARVAPNVVLLDARMRNYFDSPEVAADRGRFYAWMGQSGARLVGRVDDPTYGLMEVYQLSR